MTRSRLEMGPSARPSACAGSELSPGAAVSSARSPRRSSALWSARKLARSEP